MSDSQTATNDFRATEQDVRDLRTLLGEDVVLLPVQYGEKRPILKKWQNLPSEAMSNPEYVASLRNGNIGVLLGAVSGHLVSIDLDTGDYLVQFLELNPDLQESLITKGRRGGNVWLRLEGEYPASFNIKLTEDKSVSVGEFRASGRHTVIHGLHPDGMGYRKLRAHKPMTLTWDKINWPQDWLINSLPPLPDEYQALVEEYGEPVDVSKSGSVKMNHAFFVAKFKEERPIVYAPGRGFYEYQQTTGIWIRISQALLKKKFSEDLGCYARKTRLTDIEFKRTDSLLTSLSNMLEGFAETDIQPKSRGSVLHFRNGMLHLDEDPRVLKRFSPEYYSLNAIPFDFDPGAKCPKFLKVLKEAVGVSDAELVLKWLGMTLTGVNFAQKILLLTGIGGAGKGLLVQIIRKIIGEKNCEQLRTGKLNDRFELSRFIDKTLLIGADVPGDFLNLAGAQALKGLTGGDLLSPETKFVNGSCQMHGNFNVCITSNQRLRVQIDGDREAWRRRILLVDFKKPVQKKNPNLAEEIIREEAAGIINLALIGLDDLNRAFAVNGCFGLTSEQRSRVESLMDESDSIRSFVRERVVAANERSLTTEELVDAYEAFCGEHGWVEQPSAVVTRQLPQLMSEFFQVTPRHDIERYQHAKRGYKGVAFKSRA